LHLQPVAFSTTCIVLFHSWCLASFADLALVILSYLGSDHRSGSSTNLLTGVSLVLRDLQAGASGRLLTLPDAFRMPPELFCMTACKWCALYLLLLII